MRLLLFIGPDVLALKYESKKVARKSLASAISRAKLPRAKLNSRGHLACKFKGRPYTIEELSEALILTPMEYWQGQHEDGLLASGTPSKKKAS